MKILQINAVYGIGSTGRMVQDISRKLLAQGHASYIFWAIDSQDCDDGVNLTRIGNLFDHKLHALLRRIDGKQGWHSLVATQKVCAEILKIDPDVVHLHNLHSNYIHLPTLLAFLGTHNYPTLITLHDCWMFTAGKCMHYQYYYCNEWTEKCSDCPAGNYYGKYAARVMFEKKKALYGKMNKLYVNGVSEWTTQAARYSMINTAKSIQCIYNWVDTDIFKPQSNTKQIRKRYAIPKSHKLILGVSHGWSKEKGLNEFIQIAEELKDCATVILVGKSRGITETENLRCVGFTNNRQELVELYSAADVLVNPSKAETFGLVTVEAMACGTPVVAYNNSGTTELIAPQCGKLVPDGEICELIMETKQVLNEGKQRYISACCRWVHDNFEKDKQIQKYIDLYSQMISE